VAQLKAEPYKKGQVELEETKKKAGEEAISQDDYKEIESLTKYLSGVDVKKYGKIFPVDFEKDDDSNHHIDWITAATNMRAWNYHIEPSKHSTVRMTAGRIIPAIATTTAAITGFVQLEVFKYIMKAKFEAHRYVRLPLSLSFSLSLHLRLTCSLFRCCPQPSHHRSGCEQLRV
jgi:ubiquitin-activating enzyme E1